MTEPQCANTSTWQTTRYVILLFLLVPISYSMGLVRGKHEKALGEYSALKAQYDRTETEYAALKGKYDQCSSIKAQFDRTETEYAALKAQYDRIEQKRTKTSHE